MICPFCSFGDTRVIDSRENDTYDFVRRRRECQKCVKRFTTYERCELELSVIKRDGRKEPFDRDKLKIGIMRACSKRPIGLDVIDKIVAGIEMKLRKKGSGIKSEHIGNLVMNSLKRVDKVAYIRFASVYQDFNDVKSFEKEAKLLMN